MNNETDALASIGLNPVEGIGFETANVGAKDIPKTLPFLHSPSSELIPFLNRLFNLGIVVPTG